MKADNIFYACNMPDKPLIFWAKIFTSSKIFKYPLINDGFTLSCQLADHPSDCLPSSNKAGLEKDISIRIYEIS